MTAIALERDPRAAVSILFAASVVPLVMLLSLAVDIGDAISAKSALQMAADTAAMQGVRVATQAMVSTTLNNVGTTETAAQADVLGTTALTQWFSALAPRSKAQSYTLTTGSVSNAGVTYTARVVYGALVPTAFARIFGAQFATIGISGTAVSQMELNAYTEVDMLIDDSGSMLIASTASGVTSLQNLTPCSINGDLGPSLSGGTDGSGQGGAQITTTYCSNLMSSGKSEGQTGIITGSGYYEVYSKASTPVDQGFAMASGWTYGSGTSEIAANSSDPESGNYGQLVSTKATSGSKSETVTAWVALTQHASAACGFACHWDNSSSPNDFYTTARANNIQLRYDVVQSAATQVLTAMEAKEANTGIPDQFSTGIYMFQNSLTQVYPASGNATSTNLPAAVTALSTIEPVATTNSPDTDFVAAVTTLTNGSYLTAQVSSGAGNAASTPKKNIFIITDGIEDYCTSSCNASGSGGSSNNDDAWVTPQQNGTRIQQPIQPSDCQALKSLNFNVWVLYTTYTPLTSNSWYNSWIAPFNNATPSTITTDLQGCASTSAQMYQASDPADIATAMQTMLVAAESQPARLSQ